MAVPQHNQSHKQVLAGYDAETDTLECRNCGGQYMMGRPTGQVNIDYSGQPCVHVYDRATIGRCLTQYTCRHCGDGYTIDSGD